MQTFEQLQTVYAREPDIEHNERGLNCIETLPEALRIRKYVGLIPLILQDAGYRGTDVRLIVYYANRVHVTLVQYTFLKIRHSRCREEMLTVIPVNAIQAWKFPDLYYPSSPGNL
jgi:hypothetical protein